MSQTSGQIIYTVGHSNHEVDQFIKLLQSYSIDIVVDVRSAPYSRHCPQFNKNTIEQVLSNNGMKYLFLGKELGARPDSPECYEHNRVKYDKLKKTDLFRQGIERLKAGAGKCIVTLMCSEKDPINCHRTILISRVLKGEGIEVRHILDENKTVSQNEIEEQLQKKFELEPLLFDSAGAEQARIGEAYRKQEEKITCSHNAEENKIVSEY